MSGLPEPMRSGSRPAGQVVRQRGTVIQPSARLVQRHVDYLRRWLSARRGSRRAASARRSRPTCRLPVVVDRDGDAAGARRNRFQRCSSCRCRPAPAGRSRACRAAARTRRTRPGCAVDQRRAQRHQRLRAQAVLPSEPGVRFSQHHVGVLGDEAAQARHAVRVGEIGAHASCRGSWRGTARRPRR